MGEVTESFTIPAAQFIEDVPKFMEGKTVDDVFQQLNDLHRQYKLVEASMLQKKARLLGKLPELEKACSIVDALIAKKEASEDMMVDFELADQVFAKAKVSGVESVNLWLGANIMVEYPLDEAKELLKTNLSNCKENIRINNSNLDKVKDYITVTEVSIARVFNYDVERRRQAKETGSA